MTAIFSNQLCNQTPTQILTVTNMAFNVPLLYVNCISLQFSGASHRAAVGVTINTEPHLWCVAYAAQFTVLEVCGGSQRKKLKSNCSLTQTEEVIHQATQWKTLLKRSGSHVAVSTLAH